MNAEKTNERTRLNISRPVEKTKIGKIKSRNSYPDVVKYGATSIRITPRGSTMNDIIYDRIKLPLPKGLVFIENN